MCNVSAFADCQLTVEVGGLLQRQSGNNNLQGEKELSSGPTEGGDSSKAGKRKCLENARPPFRGCDSGVSPDPSPDRLRELRARELSQIPALSPTVCMTTCLLLFLVL